MSCNIYFLQNYCLTFYRTQYYFILNLIPNKMTMHLMVRHKLMSGRIYPQHMSSIDQPVDLFTNALSYAHMTMHL